MPISRWWRWSWAPTSCAASWACPRPNASPPTKSSRSWTSARRPPMSQHDHGSELSETQLRVRALETILTEKGYVDPAALDLIVETFETKIGPKNGAHLVARAWIDPDFKAALLKDAT